MYAAGRAETVLSWFDWVDMREGVERHPAVAALAAYVCALTGRPAAADRWADVAERCAEQPTTRNDAEHLAMWLTTVRGVMCRHGMERMRIQVDDPASVPRAGSAQDLDYPMRLFLSGVANMLLGDDGAAETRFTDAIELTDEVARPPLFSFLLAHRAELALGRGNWSEVETHVQGALSVVRRGHTESHISSALVFALAARLALHRRDPARARAQLGEAQRLRPLLTHAVPWISVATLLEMAEVSIGLGDPSAARQFTRDAETVLRRRPDLGSLSKRTDELRGRLAALEAAGAQCSTLTSAELRILPLLVTHLSLAGIADRLFVSRHTVKSQVWSMYRKLDVHTRSDAVTRARELRLLDA
jgi:LuxR family maltose regulon positive regulatory protein